MGRVKKAVTFECDICGRKFKGTLPYGEVIPALVRCEECAKVEMFVRFEVEDYEGEYCGIPRFRSVADGEEKIHIAVDQRPFYALWVWAEKVPSGVQLYTPKVPED